MFTRKTKPVMKTETVEHIVKFVCRKCCAIEGENLKEYADRITQRIWNQPPPENLISARNIHDWAMTIRRPGESIDGGWQMNLDIATYLAKCVVIAQELEKKNKIQAKQVFENYEEKRNLERLANSLKQTAKTILRAIEDD